MKHNDKEITSFVLAGIDYNPFMIGTKIEVETSDGVVTLKGTVEDARQKAEVEKIAKGSSPDIKEVVNQVEIKPQPNDSLMAVQAAASYNLRVIPAVKEALLQHPWLDVTGVTVAAAKGREGIFYLTGQVPDDKHMAEAEITVNAVPGVKYCVNELEVGEVREPGNIAPDMETKNNPKACSSLLEKYIVSSRNLALMNDIRAALLKHPTLDATDISVQLAAGCDIGIYKLEGSVPSARDKEAAMEAAKGVRGVQYIENNLAIG